MRSRNRPQVRIRTGAYFAAALGLLLLPVQWCAAALIAGFFHELCHYGMIRFTGGRVEKMEIGAAGAIMETAPMDSLPELICALAGPIGGGLLMLAGRWFPRVAICAALQTAWNLLPIYPLDGGRAVRAALCAVLPEGAAVRLATGLQRCAAVGVAAAFFWCFFRWRYSIWFVAGAIPLLLRVGKIACKSTESRVQ